MKKHPFINYLNKITFFSIGICFIIMLLWLFVSGEYIRTAPYYIAVFYVVTTGFWAFLYFIPKKGIIKFEQAYMITKTAKIIIYALVFALVLVFGWEKNIKFAIAYLSLYLVYTVFDTITVMQLIKDNKASK